MFTIHSNSRIRLSATVQRGLLMLCLLAFCIPAVHADDAPLRLAVAGVTHGHLGEVVRRMRRGDFEVVGVAEPRDEYRTKNDLTGRLDPSLFYADLGQMLDETHPEDTILLFSLIFKDSPNLSARFYKKISCHVPIPLSLLLHKYLFPRASGSNHSDAAP